MISPLPLSLSQRFQCHVHTYRILPDADGLLAVQVSQEWGVKSKDKSLEPERTSCSDRFQDQTMDYFCWRKGEQEHVCVSCQYGLCYNCK